MHRRSFALILIVPLLLSACGNDDDSSTDSSTEQSETLPADQAAVRDALVASFFDPSCDLLTDEYLLEKAFAAETPEEACEEHMAAWVEPLYDEDDVLVSDITISGDVATAVVSSEGTNITVTYELTQVGGTWLLSCDDFACDRLSEASEEPSAEVS